MSKVNIAELRNVFNEALVQQNHNWQVYMAAINYNYDEDNFEEIVQVAIDFLDNSFDMLQDKKDDLLLLKNKKRSGSNE